MAFTIVTDTSANLPSELLRRHGVGVIPFTYSYEGREHTCLDTAAFDAGEGERYYARLKDGMRVTTSQITPARYVEFFEPMMKEGGELLFVSMSSGISNSCSSAFVAAEELNAKYPGSRICVFDTLAASLGEGKAVLRAIDCRDRGMSLDDTLRVLEAERVNLYQAVLLDDLMFLHRGGRVSAPKALLGTVLGLRPILKGSTKGELVVCGKVRGRRRGLAALAEKYEKLIDRSRDQLVGIAYTDCPEDAYALRDTLAEIWRPAEFLIVRYEPVTGSYVGPGTVALFFDGLKNAREF